MCASLRAHPTHMLLRPRACTVHCFRQFRSHRCIRGRSATPGATCYLRPSCPLQHGNEGDKRRERARGIVGSIAAILCLASSPAAVASQQIIEGPARVVDGDTLEVSGLRIRLFGLDAPEKMQSCSDRGGRLYSCGLQSKEALAAKLQGLRVRCEVKSKDMYGRNVSRCSTDGLGDIGHWLVSNGYAVAYRQYSKAYVSDEAEARHAQQGIWKGAFEVPADWRKEHKNNSTAKKVHASMQGPSLKEDQRALLKSLKPGVASIAEITQPGNSCNIKGNISAQGRKLFFSPNTRGYDSVKIDTAAGERWFCNAEEAEEAGWRRPKY